MERDEHEMLIEYSEMTAFDFNSKEFQEVRRDVSVCKDIISNIAWTIGNFVKSFNPTKSY